MSTAETPKRRGRPPKVKEAPAPTSLPQGEMVVPIPLTEPPPFPNHPFKVRDDETIKETTENVKEYGVLTPAIVRPRKEGGYEIVAGYRSKRVCELAGLTVLPTLVRNLDDDTATILIVDSNIQRENILPSERAQAYKVKLEAIKRRGARTDLTSSNNSAKLRSDDEIGAAMGMSGDTVRDYISLTQLVPELQQMVDDKKIAVTPAYQIAALKPEYVDCRLCAEYAGKKKGCTAQGCPWLAERIEAGMVGYEEADMEMFPRSAHLDARLHTAIRRFIGSLSSPLPTRAEWSV